MAGETEAARVTGAGDAATRRVARVVFLSFVLTFIASRILVFLIMARRLPDLYLHVGGNHIHHLNYGIFLLSGIGAYQLFAVEPGAQRERIGLFYGIGLALTFDEFGMWLHLNGEYWQRASFDAVVVLGSVLGLAAFAPPLRRWRTWHRQTAAVVVVAIVMFALLLAQSFRFAAREAPRLQRLEQDGPR